MSEVKLDHLKKLGKYADQLEKVADEVDTLQSKLTEMEQVLGWASENVWLQRWPERSQQERWTAYPLGVSKWHNAPTLY